MLADWCQRNGVARVTPHAVRFERRPRADSRHPRPLRAGRGIAASRARRCSLPPSTAPITRRSSDGLVAYRWRCGSRPTLPPGREATFLGFSGSRVRLIREVVCPSLVPYDHAGVIFCHVNLAVIRAAVPATKKSSLWSRTASTSWEQLSLPRRVALRRAAEVWPVSDYTARVVQRLHGVPTARTRVIKNCLDSFWSPGRSAPSPEAHFALAVSRLGKGDRYKGLDVTIRAFARLPASLGPVELMVVGDGEDRARLEALAAASGARVRFLGPVSDERLQELYGSCAFFVLPSSKEGFGLVYLEAMAAGRAVVAASATAVPEIVSDGVDRATGGCSRRTGAGRGHGVTLLGPGSRGAVRRGRAATAGDPLWLPEIPVRGG